MKFFIINKNQSALLITLLAIIFLGAGYFFIYLPQNETRIQQQRFNALQNIDRTIHTKIENSVALLNNLLYNYQKANGAGREKLKKYIKGYGTNNFTLIPPDAIKSSTQVIIKDSLYMDSAYTINVNNDTREINLSFSKWKLGENNDTTAFKMGMKFSFKQFILFLLPNDVFDEYIIFSKGKPVYESFPSGISYVKEDSLLGFKNGMATASVSNQVISGTYYKMFLQPVGFDASNQWIIGGLLSNKHYQHEKTQLPTQMILLLATVLLICMVAFPWLKLYQMGSKDRLTISDGIASIFISMILVSLLFFIFFDRNFSFRPPASHDAKISLANGIDKAFKSEVDSAFHTLGQFDKLVATAGKDIINLNKNSIRFSNGDALGERAQAIRNATHGININQVFWLDKNGNEIINWAADSVNAPPGNYKNRAYFKNIAEHREYLLNGDDTSRFFLEQVMSWTSGTFRSVISMKSRPDSNSGNNNSVVALSFNLKSLDKVVLPSGYLFAVTDNSGNVLYHSDSSRNLNENLVNVFSKSNQLKSLLNAKVSGSFHTKYYGNDYSVQVKPIDGLPYFILILEDTIYDETRDLEIFSFTFSMLFFFFAFLVLQLFIIFLVSAKRSFLKKRLLDTTWLGPKISNHKEYVLSAIYNGVVIFLLLIFFKRGTFLEYLFMLLLSVTTITLFLNNIFAKRYFDEKRNALQFKKSAKYCLWAFIGIIAIIAFKILGLNSFMYLAGYELLLILSGLGVFYFRRIIVSMSNQLKQSKRYRVLFGNWTYVNSFALMILTRLIITSGLPVVFFYTSSYNYEQNIAIRYRQVDFVNQLVNKFPGVSPATIIDTNNKWTGVYYDSSLISEITVFESNAVKAGSGIAPHAGEDGNAIELLKLFRLYLTDKSIVEDKFNSQGTVDSSFFFNNLLNEASTGGAGSITYKQSSLPKKYFKIQSADLNYQYPSIFKKRKFDGALFWILLFGTLVLFYFIVRSIIKKLFALNLPDLEVWKELDNKILINKNWDQPLFVIGLPGSGKKKYLLDKINNGEIKMDDGSPFYFNNADEKKNNVFVAELINIPSSGNEETEKISWAEYVKKVFDEKNRLVIINHFEYNIKDSLSNRLKLEFLEQIFLENKCKIVILSTIHPVAFLDSAMDHSFKPDDKSIAGQDLERWHVLLGHYRIIILPLQLVADHAFNTPMHGTVIQKNNGNGIPDAAIIIKGTAIETFTTAGGRFILPDHPMPFTLLISLEGYYNCEIDIANSRDLLNLELSPGPSYISAQLIRNETDHTYFLKRMQGPAFEAGKGLSEQKRIAKFDELTFKFQVSSHYFYMYIWQSLTKEEKFLLYDLAEDNLVNSFDDYNLSMLIAKGVVIRPDGTLRLFNKGFRNFILTAIGNSEAIKIKNQIKENGNWNTLKNPLQLVILAILAFLLTSQEEAFAKLITYVAALGAGVPAVLKLFSLFDKNSQKPV